MTQVYNAGDEIRELARRLRLMIDKELASFQLNTGLSPSSMTVQLLDVSTMNQKGYLVSQVHLDFRY